MKAGEADEKLEIGRQNAGASQVDIRRLADRKQVTRRWISGDWQTESR